MVDPKITIIPRDLLEDDGSWRQGYPYDKKLSREEYEDHKHLLQIQLLKLQSWVRDSGERIVLIFEGRDAAGKGGRGARHGVLHADPIS